MNNMKALKKTAFALFSLILFSLGYFAYSALYPNDSFYQRDFEKNAAMAFPASAVILKKEATFPDIHGAYTSKAIVRLSPQDYQAVYQKLRVDPIFKEDTSASHFLGDTIDFFEARNIDISKIKTILIGVREAQFKVGFLIDGETIVFERHIS
jgi:hypothetical protein